MALLRRNTRNAQRERPWTIGLTVAALTACGALLLAACGGDDAVSTPPATQSAEPAPASAPEPVAPAPAQPAPAAPEPAAPVRPAAPPDQPDSAPGGAPSSSVPTDYADVAPGYHATRIALLDAGRNVVETVLNGDPQTAWARFSEELQRALPAHELEAAIEELRGDRVQFGGRVGSGTDETNVTFWGRLVGDTIVGDLAIDRDVASFSLERLSQARPASRLAGQWEGAVTSGAMELPIAVTFKGKGTKLRGTINVPDVDIVDARLDDVSFETSVETGEFQAESALLVSPDARLYLSEYSWGSSTLVMTVGLDASGAVVALEEPSWRIPPQPDPHADLAGTTEFRLPFDGIWSVSSGGPTELETHHVAAPSQRHGYDLIVWNDGGPHRGDGMRNDDHWAWSEPTLAPASGTIVAVVDGITDNAPGVTNTAAHPAGNHVVLRTGADEFVFIGHLQQGTISVEDGDAVGAGAVLGLTGNSGNSFAPHVHIHLQDEADFFSPTARGLPLPFTTYFLNGELVERASPIRGDLVQHRAS